MIESVNSTLKGQLDPGTTRRPHPEAGVAAWVLQRLLALTAAIWHNHKAGQPGPATRWPPTTTDLLDLLAAASP